MKIIFELPFYSSTCVGVSSTIKLAKAMRADVRFQRLTDEFPKKGKESWYLHAILWNEYC